MSKLNSYNTCSVEWNFGVCSRTAFAQILVKKWHVDCFYENLQLSTFTRCNTQLFFWVVTDSVPLISNSLSHFLSDFAFHPTYNVTVFRRRAENKLSDEGKQTLSKVRSLEQQDWQKRDETWQLRKKCGKEEEKWERGIREWFEEEDWSDKRWIGDVVVSWEEEKERMKRCQRRGKVE